MPTAGWWEALWPDPVGVLAAVGLRPGMDVIDLISGDGWFNLQIAKMARHVSAIDIDPNLLEVVRRRLEENEVTNCEFIAGDAYDIATLTAPADFVFMANAFHGIPDRARLAQAVETALKADGRFVIVNWHKRPREETPILGEPRGPKTELRMSPEETIKSGCFVEHHPQKTFRRLKAHKQLPVLRAALLRHQQALLGDQPIASKNLAA
jgi:ubiquinone/menaquinone biosynthesis C-methylase UbiE